VRNRPAFKFAVALVLGILIEHFFKLELKVLISSFALAFFLYIVFSRKSELRSILIFFLVILSGALKYVADYKLEPRNFIVKYANDTAVVKIQGYVISLPEVKNNRTNFIIRSDKIFVQDREIDVSGDVFVSIRKGKSPFDVFPSVGYGDKIEVIGVLKKPIGSRNPEEFDFGRYLKIHDIDAVFLSYILSHVKVVEKFKPSLSQPIEFLKSVAFKIRLKVFALIDSVMPSVEASFLKGLTLGYRGEMPKEVRQYFIDTGTYHILAVSGLHVGIISSMFFALTSFLRVGLMLRISLTIFGLVVYAFIVGLPPSVVRAVIMASIFLIGVGIERRIDIFNLLGFSAILILLFDSKQIFHPGFQLSFSAVASIVYFYPRIFKFVSNLPLMSSYVLLQKVLSLFFVSLSAQILTLPFTVSYFNKISFISLIANIFIVPLVGIAVPLGFAMLISYPISGFVGDVFANATWFVLNLTLSLAKFLAEIPFAYVEARSDVLFSIALVYLSLFLIVKIKSKNLMKRIVFAVLIVANIYVYFFSDGVFFERKNFKSFEVTVLDVGQGDAIFVQFPDGKNILIDGGNKTFNFDPGQRVIEPFLKKKGINKIDAVLVTHPHNDHIGGIPYILENFEVGAVIDNGLNYSSEIYRRYLDIINRKGIRHIVARAGDKIELSKVARIYVLHPIEPFVGDYNGEDKYGSGHAVNNSSVVIKIQYGGNSFLFMGDAEKEAEESMIKIYDTFLKSDWIKVGHHGSETSSSPAFVLKVKPTWAVISVGKYNKYNHPSDIVLRRYNLIGSKIHRTDEEGAGVFRSDGKDIEKVQWRD